MVHALTRFAPDCLSVTAKEWMVEPVVITSSTMRICWSRIMEAIPLFNSKRFCVDTVRSARLRLTWAVCAAWQMIKFGMRLMDFGRSNRLAISHAWLKPRAANFVGLSGTGIKTSASHVLRVCWWNSFHIRAKPLAHASLFWYFRRWRGWRNGSW